MWKESDGVWRFYKEDYIWDMFFLFCFLKYFSFLKNSFLVKEYNLLFSLLSFWICVRFLELGIILVVWVFFLFICINCCWNFILKVFLNRYWFLSWYFIRVKYVIFVRFFLVFFNKIFFFGMCDIVFLL